MSNNFSESLDKLQTIEKELNHFLSNFELVFDQDWYMSRACLKDDTFYISKMELFLIHK